MKKKNKIWLAVFIIAALGVSFATSYYTLSRSCLNSALSLVSLKIAATESEIDRNAANLKIAQEMNQRLALAEVRDARSRIDSYNGEITTAYLQSMCTDIGVDEIHVIDQNGIISHSSVEIYLGYDMADSNQSKWFLQILEGDVAELVQEPQPMGYDQTQFRQFAAAARQEGGFVQIALKEESYGALIELADISAITATLTIGEKGGIVLSDQDGIVIGSPLEEAKGKDVSFFWTDETQNSSENLSKAESALGTIYYMNEKYRDYNITGVIMADEVFAARETSLKQIGIFNLLLLGAGFALFAFFSQKAAWRLIDRKESTEIAEQSIFVDNEIKANLFACVALLILLAVFGLAWVLDAVEVFDAGDNVMNVMMYILIPVSLAPYLIFKFSRKQNRWLKYFIIFSTIIAVCCMDTLLTYCVPIFMVLPLLLSCQYYSKKLTLITAVILAVAFAMSTICGVYYGFVDLNNVIINDGTVMEMTETGLMEDVVLAAQAIDYPATVVSALQYNYLPKILALIVLLPICMTISTRTHGLLVKQIEDTKEKERISAELNVATNIQVSMLPQILPDFPGRPEFDMFASMNPAREVGGDFYDCFFVDHDHFVFVIADVSGKGVPAALFMVIAKVLIKNHMLAGLSPAEAFTAANEQLCEGNDENMFVTAWLGLLEISSGKLAYVNAGHNPPLLKRAGGEYTYLKEQKGLILAVLDIAVYKQSELTLAAGDSIYLYTDGVTEAMDTAEQQYGEERLAQVLNNSTAATSELLLLDVYEDILKFAVDAEQSDDITMLALRLT